MFFSTFNCLCITDKALKNSKFKRTDVFNKRTLTQTTNQLEGDAETTKGTKNTLKARILILIRQYSVLGTK